MRTLMVLTLDVGPEAAVEGLEGGEIMRGERGQQLSAYGTKPPFLLTLSLWLVSPCVDQSDAELGADQFELAGAVGGTVVAVMCPL